MTPKQKLIKLFKEHDYSEEYSRYTIAHASNPVYYPNFENWLTCTDSDIDSGYNVICKAIVAAGYKNTTSNRTWLTASKVYAQVGALKENN